MSFDQFTGTQRFFNLNSYVSKKGGPGVGNWGREWGREGGLLNPSKRWHVILIYVKVLVTEISGEVKLGHYAESECSDTNELCVTCTRY